jgi:FAD/FMN-containing dehydrogenase
MRTSQAKQDELRNLFHGEVIEPSGIGYDEARRVWNGAVDHHPALIVRPVDAAAVSVAVCFANRNGMPIAVLGGGYDWAGRSVRSGAMVIDLINMAFVDIDAERQIARVGGGSKSNEVLARAGECGLAAITGAVGHVGITGFTLSGGYGPLTPSLGLGVDNLLSAELVLADGTLKTVSEEKSSELLWALKGGGGNFGVVTSLELRLHRVSEILAGKVLYPWSGAAALLENYGQRMESAPEGLAATLALVTAPDGKPAVALAPCWQGDLAEGSVEVENLTAIGKPVLAKVGKMKPKELFSLFEANAVPGRRYVQQTRWLPTLGPDVVQALLAAAQAKSSPLSAIAIQSFHGVPARVPVDATAFPIRSPHFLVSIVAAWEDQSAEADKKNRAWASETSRALEPFSLPGGYASLLGPNETEQIAQIYGSNKERLTRIKRQFDPSNRFIANGPIPL